MATEKTPLLASIKDDVIIDMAIIENIKLKKIIDENNNVTIKESLNYEQLLPYIIDPYWIRVRKIFFSLYCTTFIVILLAACISAFMSTSSCKTSPIFMNHIDKSFALNDTNIVSMLFSQYDQT
ncbi:hypothetical protein PVAND_000728 [Polypedilum vanderplanki]|uniref:Solute carrier family 3 member 2 N-terminal domain-containing protein n=1 Tax=Polypedilum vanderplanki TaxID=319348 RepID=A0A9J6BKR0_POLVA|nr:hypothetical protein PVAND_000728 [Polypedilum vanderplanki]